MEASQRKQKLYCYVDESGQDIKSEFFIVVAVINDKEQQIMREELKKIETVAGTGGLKWHKSRHERRTKYLQMVLRRSLCFGTTYFGAYKKPLPFFFPILETIKKAITKIDTDDSKIIVCVDGIDKKKAAELTNALRIGGIKLEMVRSKRDESEPFIRLTDMWAGCIRDALLSKGEAKVLFEQSLKSGYLVDISTKQ